MSTRSVLPQKGAEARLISCADNSSISTSISWAFQESKSPEFCSCVDKVLRLSSGCHKNQQGVELWINLAQPFGYINHQPLFLDRHDIQVVHKDPRVLLASIETVYWQSWLLVAYAPQSGLPLEQREQWWTALSELIHRRDAGEHMIAMIDANAAPGAGDDVAVLLMACLPQSTPHCSEDLWKNTLFSYLVQLPPIKVTFSLGQTPQESINIASTMSFCLGTFSNHALYRGLSLNLTWARNIGITNPLRPILNGRRGFHKDIGSKKKVWVLIPISLIQLWPNKFYRATPQNHGIRNIEEHVQDFNQHVLTGLRQACPLQKTKPKKPYITETEWLLRADKLKTKKRLRALMRRQKDERLGVVFRAWKHRGSSPTQRDHYLSYQNYLWCVNLRLVANYRRAALELRNNLKQAKQAHIKEKFIAVPADAPAGHILKELRPILGPSNLKKLKVQTLPHIRNAQGEVCSRPSEMVEVWLEFFRQMEGGVRMDGPPAKSTVEGKPRVPAAP